MDKFLLKNGKALDKHSKDDFIKYIYSWYVNWYQKIDSELSSNG